MTWLDTLLQRWRMRMAIRQLPSPATLLDIGTHDGLMFRLTGATGLGIDPGLAVPEQADGQITLVKGFFPSDLPDLEEGVFDAATALAVVEHVPDGQLDEWADALARLIKPGGAVIITVPAPAVDQILHVLMKLRLVAGMEAHQHHGFEPGDLDSIFTPPTWKRRRHRRFQLGLNHLFVFERV